MQLKPPLHVCVDIPETRIYLESWLHSKFSKEVDKL